MPEYLELPVRYCSMHANGMDGDGVYCTSDDFIPGMSFGLEGFVMDIDIGWEEGYISIYRL